MFIVTELYGEGGSTLIIYIFVATDVFPDLRSVLEHSGRSLSWKLRARMARDIAAALDAMHSLRLIHRFYFYFYNCRFDCGLLLFPLNRDIKSDNVLVRTSIS